MDSKKKKTFTRLKNDLEDLETDGPVDYKEEDLLMKPKEGKATLGSDFWQDTKRAVKNFLVASLCVLIVVLWWFDWNFLELADSTSDMVSGIFGNEPTQVAPPAPNVEGIPPLPPMPELPSNLREEIQNEIERELSAPDISMSEYVSELEQAGLREFFSMPAITTFYQAGVKLDYLNALQEANLLKEFSFPAIVSFNSADVDISYLTSLRDEGLLEELSFPGITALFASDVPVSYLIDLREKELLQDLSFTDIIMMYEGENN